ncbi:MAG TPA: response regulator, partial [Chitinophagaceae bacterium]|nr:response regulator [Chitinophagaceae bacterium]
METQLSPFPHEEDQREVLLRGGWFPVFSGAAGGWTDTIVSRGGIGMDKGNILVVDDSPLVLEVISKFLIDKGYNTLTACDGIDAIEKTFTELPDLIILDVAMPKMNGYQVCRLLKSDPETCTIPIIILTVKDQAHDKYWGIQTGADAYLSKELEQSTLLK